VSNIIKKILSKILESFIGLLIGPLIPVLYSTIISRVYNLSFIETIKNLPIWIWLIAIMLVIIWIIIKIIKSKMNEGISPYSISHVPIGGWEKIGEYLYMGLIWDIEIPNREYSGFRPLKEKDIEIGSIRCPICKTKIDYNRHYLWYTWNCVDPTCNFKKRTWNSRAKMENATEKLAKREFERQQENKKNH